MKRANIYLADGFEEIEAITVIDVLRRIGVIVNTVSISESKEVKGAHGIPVIADYTYDEIDNYEAEMLILPGGMPGTTNLDNHGGLKDLIKDFYHMQRYIGAICAAPSILGKMELLASGQATCYPGFEDTLKDALHSEGLVARHKNIITSKGPGTAFHFALALAEVLVGSEKVEMLKEQMIIQE